MSKLINITFPDGSVKQFDEGIKAIDSDAFFVVTDSYQVEGAK